MATPSTIPTTIGKYACISELANSSSSVTYLARDTFMNRDVAIKQFNTRTYPNDIERDNAILLFTTETSLAGKLNHPHIANIVDAQMVGKQAYLVTEYIAGTSLDHFVGAQTLLSLEKVMQTMYKCCMALDYAQNQGLLHRALRPASITLTDEEEVKISDFGVAHVLISDETIHADIDSLAYVAPEQIREDNICHQSDIYALGIVMYRLLTGRFPYEADNTFVLGQKIMDELPMDIRQIRPEIPEKIAALVHTAIEKDKALRFLLWKDFAHEIAESEQTVSDKTKQITDSAKMNSLKTMRFFDGFNEQELWEVLNISQWANFPAGKTLVKEGEFGKSFFLLAKGQVNVLKGGKKLTSICKGNCFGEMAYIDQENALRTASIFSISAVTLMKINAIALEKASVNLQLRFNRAFLKILVQRLTESNAELMGDFVTKD